MIEYDNRHLWMKLKRIVSHFANYKEAWQGQPADRQRARSSPCSRRSFRLEETGTALPDPPEHARGQARRAVPGAREGLGIDDPEFRA